MSWTIQPFNNTDLHNIYEAIVSGGGGGGDLAGKLLDGTQDPSVPSGFYPSEINAINNHVSQTANNSAYLLNLFLGVDEPTNLSGFYPSNLNAILTDCEAIVGILSSIDANLPYAFQLFDGTRNPSDYSGFYPDHVAQDTGSLLKIESHTDLSSATQTLQAYFGDSQVEHTAASGFANPSAAAAAAAAFMNAQTGTNVIVNLTFTDHGGGAGCSYFLIYKILI